jgi:dihydropteroate synthase
VNVTPLALQSPRAVRDVLRAAGWEDGLAATAAAGAHPLALRLTGMDQDALEALVHFAGTLGLDVLTGEDWAIVSGSRSRLGALARPWQVPEALVEAATLVGQAMPGEPPAQWDTAGRPISLDAPVLMAILNVTPDSFSDGGRLEDVNAVLTHAEAVLAAGADILDVGGESTRPGRTESVPVEAELRRVVPVVEALVRAHPDVPISVDTVKSEVARAALDAGAAIVNDVSAFRLDPAMAGVVASRRAGIVLMHSRGPILEISSYRHAEYGGDIVGEVVSELRDAVTRAVDAGVPPGAVVVDPGFGFAKTEEQSLLILDQLEALQALGRPILVGPSRKRFVSGGKLEVGERDAVTAAACLLAWERGARVFRVHSPALVRDALALGRRVGGP